MRAAVYYQGRMEHHRVFGSAMAEGLRRHGVEVVEGLLGGEPLRADFSVCWGWRAQQRALPGPTLVLERGYLGDRMSWTAAGWNGLNGRADFCLDGLTDGELDQRWGQHWSDEMIQPWQTGGEYALLVGQVRGDASVEGVDLPQWYLDMAAALRRAYPDRPVMFRRHPHPSAARDAVPGLRNLDGTLEDALADAAMVVTYSSNVGVLAALAGVPVVATDRGSMARDAASHEVGRIRYPDRARWARRLAWCQWTLPEIERGDAWDHLRRGMSCPNP